MPCRVRQVCPRRTLDCTYILIKNIQGAYLATDYLISRRITQPGYLRSSVPLQNFTERWEGFQKALRANAMSPSQSIAHTLSPTINGAKTELLELLENGGSVSSCYFAEKDLIAIGAMQAFQGKGYHIPNDIAIVGFDNISESSVISPSLTTVSIPRTYMGRVVAQQLINSIHNPVRHCLCVQSSTKLEVRAFS